MDDNRTKLLRWIDEERDKLVALLSDLIAAPSPNPPGDTTAPAKVVGSRLAAEACEFDIVAPHQLRPNIVASFQGSSTGRHLALNGHIDCFPATEDQLWKYPPWSGQIAEGKVWGRGAADMKCGTVASIVAYTFLHRMKADLCGQLTLTVVSDEETNGEFGARYLVSHHPEVIGECCLNGEPSGLNTIRFGEKGALWLRFVVRDDEGHGAYMHRGQGANRMAVRLINDLFALEDIHPVGAGGVIAILDKNAVTIDAALGSGAARVSQRLTLNIGRIEGGTSVNLRSGECKFEADFRLPAGITKDAVIAEISRITSSYPGVSFEELHFAPANWSDPQGEMADMLRANITEITGTEPAPIMSLGGTDARLWRFESVPAYVYGPPPSGMGGTNEHVEIDDFLTIVRVHTLTAYDYLMAKQPSKDGPQ